MKEWRNNIISQKERVAIPLMTHPGIEFLNHTVSEAVSDGSIQYASIKTMDERFPAAAYTTIMDLTVEAEAFGAKTLIPENEIPAITEPLLSNLDDIKNLQIPSLTKGRIPEFLKACKLTADNIKDKPIFGGMIGPFSLAGRLYDMSELMIACHCEPDIVHLLLEKCTEFLKTYCIEIKKQNVQGVIIAEPIAGLLSNEESSEFSSRYVKEIVNAVQDDSFMLVLHNCGNTGHCTAAMVETEAMGFHFGNKIDMVEAIKGCPKDSLVMGNLDPVEIFNSSKTEVVRDATRALLEATREFPNFILSTGCDVPPHIPIENIKTFYEVLNEYNLK